MSDLFVPYVEYTAKQMCKVSCCLWFTQETVFCVRSLQTSVILANMVSEECHHIVIGTVCKHLRQGDDLVMRK